MINKETDLLIDKLCRCCMCEKENMHNIFEGSGNSKEAMVSLSEMLITCADVEVLLQAQKYLVTNYLSVGEA